MTQYIALCSVQIDRDGRTVAVEPLSDKHTGLFEADFDKKQEKRLLDLGAIRFPEGTEEHAEATGEEVIEPTITGTATEVKPATETAAEKKARLAAEKAAEKEAEAAAEKAAAEAAAAGTGDNLLS